MSFKSFKSKTGKAIACTVACAISLCATTYSGHIKYKDVASVETVQNNVIEFDDIAPLVYQTTETCRQTTRIFSTATTANTGTTSTTTTSNVTSTTDVVTSTTTSEVTQPVTEAQTEEGIETPVEQSEPIVIEEVEEPTEPPREYVVYKNSTHYIHRNTCHWCNNECVEISSTEGIEARKCAECNPDMEIVTPYTTPVVTTPEPATTNVTTIDTAISVTDYEYTILCNLVAGEYGSDWVSTYDKGAVVATVIHRMWEGTRWTGGADASIYNIIAAPYQYDGKYLSSSYSSRVTESCKEAVTYALNNISAYDYYTNPDGTSVYMINSFCGDGKYNWFRCS